MTPESTHAIDKAADAFLIYVGAGVLCTFAMLGVFVYLWKSFNDRPRNPWGF